MMDVVVFEYALTSIHLSIFGNFDNDRLTSKNKYNTYVNMGYELFCRGTKKLHRGTNFLRGVRIVLKWLPLHNAY